MGLNVTHHIPNRCLGGPVGCNLVYCHEIHDAFPLIPWCKRSVVCWDDVAIHIVRGWARIGIYCRLSSRLSVALVGDIGVLDQWDVVKVHVGCWKVEVDCDG